MEVLISHCCSPDVDYLLSAEFDETIVGTANLWVEACELHVYTVSDCGIEGLTEFVSDEEVLIESDRIFRID